MFVCWIVQMIRILVIQSIQHLPLKFLMTSFRMSLGFDELFVGNLISGPLLLLIAEKFGRFSPLSPTSISYPMIYWTLNLIVHNINSNMILDFQ